VARKFELTVNDHTFINEMALPISKPTFINMTNRLSDSLNFINDETICERIIRPILDVVEKNYGSLRIWSHVPYNVNIERGLGSEPDYFSCR